jgi:hypothetical protein
MNKVHPSERLNMTFIDKWSLFGGYSFLFYQLRIGKGDLYLQGALYSEMILFEVTLFSFINEGLAKVTFIYKVLFIQMWFIYIGFTVE